ncbi:magnesium transporter CorA family protein [Desulfovibrio cuneatus]|uniref:magnesium transporter CorA family protein n=1 Tax=Desulfovibrio cuneatus TaxID=159728 RepID=UPI0003F71FF1|nr:magnesium transporter CorA family protein [Desulfovibrio cuneatus]
MIHTSPVSSLLYEPLEPPAPQTWIQLTDPTQEECDALVKKIGLPIGFLLAAADINEHPRFEQQGVFSHILLRASLRETAKTKMPFTTHPISIILAPTAIITVCAKPNLVEALLQQKVRLISENATYSVLLALIFRIGTEFIRHIQQMIDASEHVEHTLQKSMQNKELLSLLHMEKSLIYFLTSLRGNCGIIDEQLKENHLPLSPKEHSRMQAAFTEMRQASDMGDVFSQILGSLGDTFGAIVSNNLNKVMKVLTALTIVLMIPTLVAGVYGMNVPLPMQDHPTVFIWISGGTTLFSLAIGYFFWKKNWM